MVTLILASGPSVRLLRDHVAFPRLRDQVRAYEAATGATVKVANA